jgi:drug/metabolite transporter (DMT)-like permease
MSRGRAHVLLLTAAVMWGWTFVATKIALDDLGPIELFGLRLAVGLPALAAVLVWRRVPLEFSRADAAPLVAGGAILAAHFLIQVAGLVTASATNTSWIITISPLAVAILSAVFLGESIGWRCAAGILIATFGIVMLVSQGRPTDLGWLRSTGDWLVLISAFTWAVYTVVTRDLVQRRHPLAVTVSVLSITAVIVSVVFVFTADWAQIRTMSAPALLSVLYLAVPGLALGHWFWQEGVAEIGATRSGLYLYLEPIATLALAVPLLGEPFGLPALLGGALVLAGVIMGQRPMFQPGSSERNAAIPAERP